MGWKLKRILKSPGIYLVLMAWWIFAFYILNLVNFGFTSPELRIRFSSFLRSHIPYLIAFIVLFSIAITMNMVEARFQFWGRLGHWGKLIVLTVSYAFAILVIVMLTSTLSLYVRLEYFGSGPAGSFGIVYLVSVRYYFILAAGVGVVWTVGIWTKRAIKAVELDQRLRSLVRGFLEKHVQRR